MNLECTPPINEFPMVMKIQVDSPVDENFSSLSGIYAMGKGKNILTLELEFSKFNFYFL